MRVLEELTADVQLVDAALVLDEEAELLLGEVDDRLHLLEDGAGLCVGRIGALC